MNDDLVISRELVQHIPCRRPLRPAALVVLPHELVKAVVEVEMLHVLELDARRREQLLRHLDMPVHRAADVEEHQHFDGVTTFRPHMNVEIALARGAFDGAVEIKFVLGTFTSEFTQAGAAPS